MNPNNLQGQLRRYYRQINRQLPCKYKERKRFLASLKVNVASYIEEQPNCTIEDILKQFGTVEDTVEAYTNPENTTNFVKRRRRLQFVSVVLAASLIACITLFVWYIHIDWSTRVTVIEVSTEIIEE